MNNFDAPPFESKSLRATLGRFVTGVTVITTMDESGNQVGLTANSFNTVSLEPPLILWSLSKNAGSYEVFQRSTHFGISILAEDQVDISQRFATPAEQKFTGVDTNVVFCPVPMISNSCAWLYCTKITQIEGGDHIIYIGEVQKVASSDRPPLVFGGGKYLLAKPHHYLPAFSTEVRMPSAHAAR